MSATVASSATKPERAWKWTAPVTPGPSTKPTTTNTAVSDSGLRRVKSRDERSEDQQDAKDERRDLEVPG